MSMELPPEILGDIFEAQEFARGHGIRNISERREELLNCLDEEERSRLLEVEQKTENLVEGLMNLPEVKRLRQLRQLAGTTNVYEGQSPRGVGVMQPAFHSRYDHSELLAEQVKFAGVKLGLADDEIETMIASAWLHDIGHPALSHLGDYFLEKKGRGDHETRAVAAIQKKNSPISNLLASENINAEKVVETILEKGYLGSVQSFCDTLSYLVVDSEMIKLPILPDQGAVLIKDLSGVDKKEGCLVVKDPKLWQMFLEVRAEMMKEVYLNPINRRQRGAMRHLMQIAINQDHLSLEDIEKGTDQSVEMRLQSLVQYDPGAAIFGNRQENAPHLKKYIELWGLAHGEFSPELWNRRMFDSRKELEKYLFDNVKPDQLEQTVVVEPQDYTRKKLPVVDEKTGEKKVLKSHEVELRDWDTKYIAYIPKFLSDPGRGK